MCDECGTLNNILNQILVLFPKKFECSQVHYKITHSKCDECAFQRAQNQNLIFYLKMN